MKPIAFVPVPRDLTKVKNKVAFNLTKRQLICFGLAAIVGVPAYFLTRGTLGNATALLLMIGLMLPFFFFALFEKDGQPAEKVLRNMLRTRVWPRRRPYRTENLYKTLSMKGGSFAPNQKVSRKKKASAKGAKPLRKKSS